MYTAEYAEHAKKGKCFIKMMISAVSANSAVNKFNPLKRFSGCGTLKSKPMVLRITDGVLQAWR